jgi:hypothetical protein
MSQWATISKSKVQGLLGITLDDSEVFLVQIDERIGSLLGFNASSDAEMGRTAQQGPSLDESPYSVKHTGFSSNSAKQPFKHSLRHARLHDLVDIGNHFQLCRSVGIEYHLRLVVAD